MDKHVRTIKHGPYNEGLVGVFLLFCGILKRDCLGGLWSMSCSFWADVGGVLYSPKVVILHVLCILKLCSFDLHILTTNNVFEKI